MIGTTQKWIFCVLNPCGGNSYNFDKRYPSFCYYKLQAWQVSPLMLSCHSEWGLTHSSNLACLLSVIVVFLFPQYFPHSHNYYQQHDGSKSLALVQKLSRSSLAWPICWILCFGYWSWCHWFWWLHSLVWRKYVIFVLFSNLFWKLLQGDEFGFIFRFWRLIAKRLALVQKMSTSLLWWIRQRCLSVGWTSRSDGFRGLLVASQWLQCPRTTRMALV